MGAGWRKSLVAPSSTSISGPKTWRNAKYFSGDPCEILLSLVKEYNASAVFWNRCYEPWRIKRDGQLKTQLRSAELDNLSVEVESFNGSLLWEPWQILKKTKQPIKCLHPILDVVVCPTVNQESH